jgi:hypothetical protein
MKGSGQICACCAFSRTEHGSSTLRELVHKSMTKRSKYGCANRFDVQDLGIADDLLNEYWMMVEVVRQGWTLVLVFGLDEVTKMQIERTKFRHAKHISRLGCDSWIDHLASEGLEMRNVQRHGRGS